MGFFCSREKRERTRALSDDWREKSSHDDFLCRSSSSEGEETQRQRKRGKPRGRELSRFCSRSPTEIHCTNVCDTPFNFYLISSNFFLGKHF